MRFVIHFPRLSELQTQRCFDFATCFEIVMQFAIATLFVLLFEILWCSGCLIEMQFVFRFLRMTGLKMQRRFEFGIAILQGSVSLIEMLIGFVMHFAIVTRFAL